MISLLKSVLILHSVLYMKLVDFVQMVKCAKGDEERC